jgi:hypothetical protein
MQYFHVTSQLLLCSPWLTSSLKVKTITNTYFTVLDLSFLCWETLVLTWDLVILCTLNRYIITFVTLMVLQATLWLLPLKHYFYVYHLLFSHSAAVKTSYPWCSLCCEHTKLLKQIKNIFFFSFHDKYQKIATSKRGKLSSIWANAILIPSDVTPMFKAKVMIENSQS